MEWRSARICTVQIATSEEIVVVQLRQGRIPDLLSRLLAAPDVEKVLHHAPFDLKFMASAWRVGPRRIACTKVLSKILDPTASQSEHSLKPLLEGYLGVRISKEEQQSDWAAEPLGSDQIAYAANDVRYLLALFDAMANRAQSLGVWELATASFDYLPARIALELRGSGDVFAY